MVSSDYDWVLPLIGGILCVIAGLVHTETKNHISMKKVREFGDPQSLYGLLGPTKDVLTEKGSKLWDLALALMVAGVLLIVLPVVLIKVLD